MEIRPVKSGDLIEYNALARESGKLFYSPEWAAIFGSRVRAYGFYEDNGELLGGFGLSETRRFGVPVQRNPPFTPVIGPFMRIRAQQPVAIVDAQRRFLETMAAFLRMQPHWITSIALDHAINDGLPFQWQGFKVIPKYTYQIDLQLSIEEIVRRFSQNRRNDISKARRDNIVVEQTEDVDAVAQFVRATFRRQKIEVDPAILSALLFKFLNPQNSFAYLAKRDGRSIAFAVIVYDRTTAYYLLGGYDEKHRHHGAGAMAILEGIKAARTLGLKIFDFEGSSLPAVERFFRGFGGRLVPFLTVNRAWLPVEVALKAFRRHIF